MVKLERFTPNPIRLIVAAARLCKNSESDSPDLSGTAKHHQLPGMVEVIGAQDVALVRKCIDLGHESVMEHASFTFLFKRFSKVAQNQLVRHRLASFSVQSHRAVAIKGDVLEAVAMPWDVKGESATLYRKTCEDAMIAYEKLIEAGVPKESARYLIPLGVIQPLFVTANVREWRHIIAERACKNTMHEVRKAVKSVRGILEQIHPLLVYGIKKPCGGRVKCGECETDWEEAFDARADS